jgi:glutamate 5-kinase
MQSNILVVKIGTNTIFTNDDIDYGAAKKIGYEINQLMKEKGIKPVLVVSGAVGLGMHAYGLKEKPQDKVLLQMCAGVGQKDLMNIYDMAFKGYATTAQMLFTYDDLENPNREKNIESVIQKYIETGTIPLINYNDTINEAEVNFDNDKFGAEIALYAKASRYLILTNKNGLLDENGRVIRHIPEITAYIRSLDNGADKRSVGGMATKLDAARICLENGIEMILGNAKSYTIKQILDDPLAEKTVFSKKI